MFFISGVVPIVAQIFRNTVKQIEKKLFLLVQDLDKSSALLFYIMHTLYIYLYTVDNKN